MKLDIKPYSVEWNELKKKCLSSTEAGIINGNNKFGGNSPNKLLKLKLGLIKADPANEKMILGMEMEADARMAFEKLYNVKAPEAVYVCDKYKWMMTTIDGDIDNDTYFEAKCGESAYAKALEQNIPDYYLDQIQHTFYVTGKKRCYYMCFQMGKEPIIIEIVRDEKYINFLIEKEIKFYEKWQSTIKSKDEWSSEMKVILTNQDLIKNLTKENDELKERLYNQMENKDVVFDDLGIIAKYENNVYLTDWSKVLEKFKIDKKEINDCIKPRKGCYKILTI